MIYLDNTLVSDEIKEVFFCCDLAKCKGACCIEGDAGAPLDEAEISLLEDYIDEIKPYMVRGGIDEVGMIGVFDYDAEGNFVTPLVDGRECVYVYFEDGIAGCAIEKAFQEKKIPFAKPISCHLYPVRIKKTAVNDLLNYHKWPICQKALLKGHKEKIPLYQFLEGALIRKYGRTWYNKLSKLLR
ncbi:MAG: DUF3109 family protein [Bacteroidota bacterium]